MRDKTDTLQVKHQDQNVIYGEYFKGAYDSKEQNKNKMELETENGELLESIQ